MPKRGWASGTAFDPHDEVLDSALPGSEPGKIRQRAKYPPSQPGQTRQVYAPTLAYALHGLVHIEHLVTSMWIGDTWRKRDVHA